MGVSRRSLFRAGAGTLAAPALLSGCGSSGSGRKELVFWQFYAPTPVGGSPDVVKQSQWFTRMVNDWNAQHETKIRLEYVTVLGNPKLATAFAAGEGPDIFLLSPGDFARYYNGGVLAELTPYMEPEAVKDFFAPNMATRTADGKVYGLPMEIEPLAMFYSEQAMESAHLAESDLPRTWDQLLDLGDKLRTRKAPPIMLPNLPGYYQNFTWYPFLWQTGADAVRHGRSGFDSAGARSALQLWRDCIQTGIAPRTSPVPDSDAVAGLGGGYATMSLSGIWTVAAFKYRKPKYRYGVIPLPTPAGGTPRTALGGWAFVANARGRDPETAAKFCVWALGSMAKESIQRVVDWCTVAKSDIAPRASALAAGRASGGYDHPVMKKFADEIFPTGRGEPRYPPVVYKAISDAIQQCEFAGADPAAQARLAGDTIDAYLTSYRGVTIL
ncbi:sugar ABC transporter substrate-binding protein [Actinocatenispora sera]|uniref:ABC transporter substrate-binding protein n=1 Tax=Actinocatenispora sera TaxID=390989 RepID=UPI0033D1D093